MNANTKIIALLLADIRRSTHQSAKVESEVDYIRRCTELLKAVPSRIRRSRRYC